MSTLILNPFEIFGEIADNAFKMTVSMSALETMVIPATGTNDFIIDWGDGSATEHITTSSPSHEYVDADSYQISINGTMTAFAFADGGNKLNVTSIIIGDNELIDVAGFARGCSNCTFIDAQSLDTSSITSLFRFTEGCTSLTALNVSGWNTSSVTNLGEFVNNCTSLTTLDVSGWNTSNVTNLAAFAGNCTELTVLAVGGWDTIKVTNITSFVRDCTSLTTLDVSGWDVSGVTSLISFAQNCTSLTTLDVSGWDVSNITSCAFFAQNCTSVIVLDTNSWDTRNISACNSSFRGMTSLTSSFDEFRWWNRTDDLTPGGTPDPIATFTNCFTNSTDISNYADIPNNWKGL